MARLDLQKPPSKYQKSSSFKQVRGYDVNPRTPWGTVPTAADVPATGAVAGTPGSWVPAGSTPPATQAAAIAGTPVTVTPAILTVWTSGQYVQTATAGVGGRVYWTGTAWAAGAKP